jgi:hypothetical protein
MKLGKHILQTQLKWYVGSFTIPTAVIIQSRLIPRHGMGSAAANGRESMIKLSYFTPSSIVGPHQKKLINK